MHRSLVWMLVGFVLVTGSPGSGQQLASAAEPQMMAVSTAPKSLLPGVLPVAAPAADDYASCSADDLQSARLLSLSQRTCLYRSRLLSKSFPIRAALFSAMAEIRNNDIKNPGMEDFTHRFATYYARRTAQGTGEFLVGALHHEDPRYHPSLEHGVWKRTRAALWSVIINRDSEGGSRVALAPIAGAFGSGMASVACYRTNNSVEDGFRRSGLSYGMYFGAAIAREFRPELTGLASRFTHRH